MPADVQESPRVDPLLAARESVRIGPVPDWVVPCAYDSAIKAKPGTPLTHLLISGQVHAEHRQSHLHTAIRLESMEAVQRESQWRLPFEPDTQRVMIHAIKIRRGTREMDQTSLERARLLQREEGLEGFVIDGWFSLLLLLEDVRPGDILETSYTIETRPRLLPGHCASFFSLPQGIPIGKFHFSARFNESRAMKWKSSAGELKPTETREYGSVLWAWSGESLADAEMDDNIPESHLAHPWVQISDVPDWGTVARAFAQAWEEELDDGAVAELAGEIAAKHAEPLARIEQAIQRVQDDFRYLSVNVELGGQVPTPPGTVMRRRYGDCKDLSFLLVHLLKRLGITARAVLVHSALKKSVAGLLPMGVFNHAVVEFQFAGESRWVDPTRNRQGGDALHRFIPRFGVGLPVDLLATSLIEPPQSPPQANLYHLKEHILLDTTGAPSHLAVELAVSGSHAELLRNQFEAGGREAVAKERLQLYASRFHRAARIGDLQYRDDRAANEFVLAEVYEINGFLTPDLNPQICRFPVPSSLLVHTLQLPESKLRRAPFALPYPCNLIHTIEIEFAALQPMSSPPADFSDPHVQFGRRIKSRHRSWTMTLTLTTLTDEVAADRVAEHRKTVEQIWEASTWQLHLPLGQAHPPKRWDFGELPAPRKKLATTPLPSKPQRPPDSPAPGSPTDTADGADMSPVQSAESRSGRRRTSSNATSVQNETEPSGPQSATLSRRERHERRRKQRKRERLLWAIILAVATVALVVVLIIAIKGD